MAFRIAVAIGIFNAVNAGNACIDIICDAQAVGAGVIFIVGSIALDIAYCVILVPLVQVQNILSQLYTRRIGFV